MQQLFPAPELERDLALEAQHGDVAMAALAQLGEARGSELELTALDRQLGLGHQTRDLGLLALLRSVVEPLPITRVVLQSVRRACGDERRHRRAVARRVRGRGRFERLGEAPLEECGDRAMHGAVGLCAATALTPVGHPRRQLQGARDDAQQDVDQGHAHDQHHDEEIQ